MVVVVLGHRLVGQTVHPELRARIEMGITAFRETASQHIVFSGGQSNPSVPAAECEVMADYAKSEGVDPTRIHTDPHALDTVGNGFFTRRVVNNIDTISTVTVVTSCYHCPRAAVVFRHCYADEYELNTDYCCKFGDNREEKSKLMATREFFEGVGPGDMCEIATRLRHIHDKYDSLPDR